jgi:hypothetical protein
MGTMKCFVNGRIRPTGDSEHIDQLSDYEFDPGRCVPQVASFRLMAVWVVFDLYLWARVEQA